VSLAIKFLKPLRFTDVLTLASEESLARALESPARSANILALTVIEKASKAPSDTAILSTMKGVIVALIRTWLSSPSVEVGEKATKTLGDLLEVDCDRASAANLNTQMNGLEITPRNPPGQGLLWRRIFHDQDIYALLFDLCSPTTTGTPPGQLDARQKSLAQARLLRLIPRLAQLDFATLSRSDFPDVAARYGFAHSERGLLYFATVQMVDKSDMLMHITLIDFVAEFLDMVAQSQMQISGTVMQYLVSLMKTATETDQALYKSLEALAMAENSSPELVELLHKLNEYR
jgi:hypothetical protein